MKNQIFARSISGLPAMINKIKSKVGLIGILLLMCYLSISKANAANQICSKSCWLGAGKIIGAAYAWEQPSDVPCSRTISWPGSKVYFIIAYEDRGKLVIIDSGWTDQRGMEC